MWGKYIGWSKRNIVNEMRGNIVEKWGKIVDNVREIYGWSKRNIVNKMRGNIVEKWGETVE